MSARFKEPGFWIGLAIVLAFASGAAIASDPRRESPTPSPWLELPFIYGNKGQDFTYNPVMVYAQCDGTTRVFVAVSAKNRWNPKATGVAIAAVPGGCERTKAEEPK